MPKWTKEYAREYHKEYVRKNKEKIAEARKAYQRKLRERLKDETGSSYDKKRYEKYKHLHAAARKRYHARKRQEKLAAGEIKPLPTPEERLARKQASEQRQKAKHDYRYKNNIDGYRDQILKNQREKRKDPVFKQRAAVYLKQWRAKKRAAQTSEAARCS